MTFEYSFDTLTDDQLIVEIQRLAGDERRATVILLRALMEVDARRLYLREGCSSLFTYCTQVLHLEEGAAYNRIEVIRAARRLPPLLDAIEDGALTLTTARLLAPHLTVDNHVDLLSAARHQSRCDVEILIAGRAPRPAVATVLRKMSAKLVAVQPSANDGTAAMPSMKETAAMPIASAASPTVSRRPMVEPCAARASNATPLSADTYKLQVTISAATNEKLRRARDLLRHSMPDGDFGEVLDRALTLLVEDLERRRCAEVTRPRPGATVAGHTRHIPAAVKREVWRRDGGRCAFSGGNRRCTETAFLEFHHVRPYADGGQATIGNIELRCRADNQYEATVVFGDTNELVRERAVAW
jgi:hypothetical protein